MDKKSICTREPIDCEKYCVLSYSPEDGTDLLFIEEVSKKEIILTKEILLAAKYTKVAAIRMKRYLEGSCCSTGTVKILMIEVTAINIEYKKGKYE